jgi:adenylate cyclase class 2
MAYEIEIKVLDINFDNVKKLLISLGAEKTRETRLSIDWYQRAGAKEGSEKWFLRIRSDSEGKHEVTWKGESDISGAVCKHKEICFDITEPEKLAELFEKIGLEKYAHQEKDRLSFSFKDWIIEMDQYPNMPPFLEVEGKNEEHVREALKILGLSQNRTWSKGERTLIQEVYGLDWYDMRF